MIKIRNLKHIHLSIESWNVDAGNSYVILGKNGSGKQYVDRLLMQELTNTTFDECELPNKNSIGLVSFETLQAVYENELKIDETDMTDEIDFGTTVKEFLPPDKINHPLINKFNLTHRLNTGFRLLSSGEGKKLLIIKMILEGAKWLVLDNPFDDLDLYSRRELSRFLSTLNEDGISVILLLSNSQDIPTWVDNFALIVTHEFKDLTGLGKEQSLKLISEHLSMGKVDEDLLVQMLTHESEQNSEALVDIKSATVTYSGKAIFNDFSLNIKPNQHTLIVGPNGCGKSTLLQMVTGDCPQCFSNNVSVVGFRRGQGETIWDIKKQLGIVSPDLHRNYRVTCSVLTVVLSGFKDSIGLYSAVTPHQQQLALDWLKLFNISDKANSTFQHLSYGEQRLVLIARAMVKKPLLLILDEPTQGLDEVNRKLVLLYLEKVAALQVSTLLMVSHRLDERLELFQQIIDMDE